MEVVTLLNGVSATGAGPAKDIQAVLDNKYELRKFNMALQVSGITVATVILEGSMDGVTYSPISGSTITGDICATLNVSFPFIQANCTEYTSGTIIVKIGI